ncbi:MAG: hypothetical protein F2817_21340 [Actinobacteria bacterium]|nr:hypothetical protein [Actinomycetota bacterium]
MKQDRIKLVVVDEHTLGFIFPQSYYDKPSGLVYVNILHASVLKGAVNTADPILIGSTNKVRLASEKDFDDFRVVMNGYKNNPNEYEFVTNEQIVS